VQWYDPSGKPISKWEHFREGYGDNGDLVTLRIFAWVIGSVVVFGFLWGLIFRP
jgi:hypothetical protein